MIVHTSSLRLNNRVGPELVELGLWLRIGFIGAAAGVAGVAQWFDGLAQPRTMLALVAGGIAVAAFSYWRSSVILANVDASTEVAPFVRTMFPVS